MILPSCTGFQSASLLPHLRMHVAILSAGQRRKSGNQIEIIGSERGSEGFALYPESLPCTVKLFLPFPYCCRTSLVRDPSLYHLGGSRVRRNSLIKLCRERGPDLNSVRQAWCRTLGIIPDFVMGKIVVKNIYKCFILGVFLELNNTKKSKTLYSNICY